MELESIAALKISFYCCSCQRFTRLTRKLLECSLVLLFLSCARSNVYPSLQESSPASEDDVGRSSW